MFKNYLRTTYRHITKSKVNFIFRVGGLTLALFGFLVVTIYVSYQFSYDRYHENYSHIYRVNSTRNENGIPEKYGVAPLALGPMIKERFPEVKAFTRIQIGNGGYVRYGQKVVFGGVFPADSSLFDVFTFKFISGDRKALSKPSSLVISQSFAKKIFGDENPLHKIVTLTNEKDLYEVTAVFEDMPSNSHIVLDGFVPVKVSYGLSLAEVLSPVSFLDHASMLYLRFDETTDASDFSSKIIHVLDQHMNKKDRIEAGYGIYLQGLADIYLDSSIRYEFSRKGSMLYIYIFVALGIFLLVVAGINYINLTIADFTTRLREVGVRKVIGASKAQIILQVVLETTFYCVISATLSVLFIYLLFPQILSQLESHLSLASLVDPRMITIVVATLLVLILFSAGLPAYRLMTNNTINDLKGVLRSGRRSVVNDSLLAFQFVASVICISATLIIAKQLEFIHNKDLGIDRKDLLVIAMPEDFTVAQMRTFKNELKAIAGVEGVSNSSFRMGGGYWKDWYSVELNGEMKTMELYEVFSDDNLLSTLGMKLIDGRFLEASRSTDSTQAFVINETAVAQLGLKDPVGKKILTHPEEKGKWEGTIVGVVGDINISNLHQKVQPLVMRLPYQSDYPEFFVYARINSDNENVLSAIRNEYNEILPGYPLDMEFVDDHFNAQYRQEDRAFASLRFGMIVIILVSAVGIFSLSIHQSARRMKEFGVRKVLGASMRQIATLHIGHFIKVAALANFVALPLSWYLIDRWLNDFAYKTDVTAGLFVFVSVSLFVLVIVSASYSCLKAAKMNPVDVIKMQ